MRSGENGGSLQIMLQRNSFNASENFCRHMKIKMFVIKQSFISLPRNNSFGKFWKCYS